MRILASITGLGYALTGVISLSLGISQLRFKDRETAGQMLGRMLQTAIKNHLNKNRDIIVLGIPRGGVIVADQVATEISADFGIIVAKKIIAPGNEEEAIGALTYDGGEYLDQNIIDNLQIASEYIEIAKRTTMEEIRRRKTLYLGDTHNYSKISGRTVIIVDDGAATGSTLIAAARWTRLHTPKHLIIAIPVAPKNTVRLLSNEADEVHVIVTATRDFRSVGQFYKSFAPATHEKVIGIMRRRVMLKKY